MSVVVVGIGADGWEGLGRAARAAVRGADVLIGGPRHLGLIPDTGGERRPWPSPMTRLLAEIPAMAGRQVCVLATGDPMLHGVGNVLAGRLPEGTVSVIPNVSALSLACARLMWAAADVELVTLVGRPLELLHPAVQPGRRLVVYVAPPIDGRVVAELLRARGYGPSRLVALEGLGGRDERIRDSTADEWGDAPTGSLCTLAVECRPEPGAPLLPRTPGLQDDAYESDGQMTKKEARAIALASLQPIPGQLLWDVGAGTGTIAIEWMRTHPACRAVAVERRPDRVERIARNAAALGVPGLRVEAAEAPAAFDRLPEPDAVFVGGGLTARGLLDACWERLAGGGRLVANAVTLDGEAVLAAAQAARGGRLVRLDVAVAEPLGRFRGWQPQRPLVQWSATKGAAA